MNNKLIFAFGSVIFIIYVYFLFKVIRKQNKTKKREDMRIHDMNDLDGMGNQGRFPDKEIKNRAI
jgi:amino acid permease